MKIISIILVEKYFSENNLKNITGVLQEKDIKYFIVYDFESFKKCLDSLSKNQPIIWFENQNYSITNLDLVCSWLFNNIDSSFPGVKDINNKVLGFYPRGILHNNTTSIELKQYWFILHGSIKRYTKPFIENPRLILFTKEREIYFNLTLNSLINSLPSEDKPPITIVLNDPISKNRAKLFVDQYGQYGGDADILEVIPNSKISAIAIALIWHKPGSFIWLEDDFILPNATKQHYPFWPKLFNEKLQFFDLCGWGVSVDNYPHFDIPKNFSKFHINNNTKFMSGQKWLYNEPFDSFILMAQGLAMKTSFYYEVSKKHNHAGLDSIFISNSKRGICSPTLLGYHIGWNQNQDGYGYLHSHAWGDFGWNDTYLVRNVVTGEEKTICPKRDIDEIKEISC